jgi:hypothetical protein
MSSYDGEKARIRAALSQDVRCSETSDSVGSRLNCVSAAQQLHLVLMGDGTHADISLSLEKASEASTDDVAQFRNVLDAYAFGGDDVKACLDAMKQVKQSPTYRVSCMDLGSEYRVHISQDKPV